MLIIPPAQSNAERQRRFRERNPGYYARLQATRRASAERGSQQMILAMQTAAQEAAVAQEVPAPAPQLLLPAPKDVPVFPCIELAVRERETVAIER